MCPLWPFHLLLMYVGVLVPLWFLSFGAIGAAAEATTIHTASGFVDAENGTLIKVDETKLLEFTYNKTDIIEQAKERGFDRDVYLEFLIDDGNVAHLSPSKISINETGELENGLAKAEILVEGVFLGKTDLCSRVVLSNNLSQPLQCTRLTVIRQAGAIDKAFTYSVAALVAIIYINMGAALDVTVIKETLKKPYGPTIGFFTQFLIMPVLAFGLGKLLIPNAALQLGLFITGCSPGGGASNIWTLTLGGNLDLSITMTTISTFAAFAMMPVWILTLGSVILEEANLVIPYSKIATFAIALVVPLGIGVLIQFLWPRVAKFLVRVLKPFAVFLIIFIVVFAIYTNLYLFQLFSWQILLAGLLLPSLGYILGGGTACLLNQNWRDIITIGIETGVQNTGLAIFALRFSLPQPEADITTVLPVACALWTPFLPFLIMAVQKIHVKFSKHSGYALGEKEDSIISTPALLTPLSG